MGGFYDLNIIVERGNKGHMETLVEMLHTAYILGYDTVAVNTVVEVDSNVNPPKGKKKGQEKAEKIPLPLEISVADVIKNKVRHQKFTILQRLTIVINDPSQTHQIQSSKVAKLYDILAVQPETDSALRMCCSTLDVDMITYCMDVKSNFFPTFKQLGLAIGRGLFFELTYVPALGSSAARRNSICNGRRVVSACNKKNLIVSSQAKKSSDIRSPYDVVNLCFLFDLDGARALDAVSACPRQVVMKAECRKSARGVFSITPTSSLTEKDLWKIKSCRNDVEIVNNDTIGDDESPKSKRLKKDSC
ncbi:Ribonuclease P protein subunit p30 [Chamberlinius hualienensis]